VGERWSEGLNKGEGEEEGYFQVFGVAARGRGEGGVTIFLRSGSNRAIETVEKLETCGGSNKRFAWGWGPNPRLAVLGAWLEKKFGHQKNSLESRGS